MQSWEKAAIFGSIGAGAMLIIAGRRPWGMAFTAAGLAVLASEYPEKFEALYENAPEYLQKSMQIFSTLQKLGEVLLRKPSGAVSAPGAKCVRNTARNPRSE